MALILKPIRKTRPNIMIEPRIPETDVPASTLGHAFVSLPGASCPLVEAHLFLPGVSCSLGVSFFLESIIREKGRLFLYGFE